jgi:cellulose 1,4-beta-cellobiosidase
MYIDAAHGGWLGWEDNAQAYATLVQSLAVDHLVRGFATNVANYQPLGSPCPSEAFDQKMHVWCADTGKGSACCTDPCGLVEQWSGGNNEYNYVQELTREMKRAMPNFDPHYIIDTSRNGVPDARGGDCAAWCNPHNAGSGHAPSTQNSLPAVVDALFWIKPPGESDGCTKPPLPCQEPTPALQCKFHDQMCDKGIGSEASEPCAPEAGVWYDFQAKTLAQNANFAATAPVRSQKVETVGPFQPCKSNDCTDGYDCLDNGAGVLRCMPNEGTVAVSKHNSIFATQFAHARKAALA